MSGPLADLTVVEMAALGPVPLAGQMLADMGADVVLVERASAPADPAEVNRRGKRSVALDLKAPEGRAAALAVIAGADVLLEGFRPGVMERLGLGPADCPDRLVYGRMTGWGQDGPLAATAGHDITYLAISGVLHRLGPAERPLAPLNLAADYAGGAMVLLAGVLAALHERQRSGRGQVIDAAMVEGAPALLGLIAAMEARGEWDGSRREANLLDGGAPFYGTYACADGRFVAVGALERPFYRALVAAVGLPEEPEAERQDRRRWPDTRARWAAHFAAKPQAHWVALTENTDACLAPVLTPAEASLHPHVAARAEPGLCGVPRAPRFQRPAPPPGPPAAAGAEGEDILAAAGLTRADIARLRARGVLR